MGKTIKHSVHFDATPHDVFDALMDSKKHAEFTGADARIDRKVGGTFSVWDGYANGRTLELVEDRKIVQTWRADDWPDGHESSVTFELNADDKGTQLNFTHENIPDNCVQDIETGWKDYYWEPMKEFFKK